MFNFVQRSFFLGARIDSRRNRRRALEDLLRAGGGSLTGLDFSPWANMEGGGNHGLGEAEDGTGCEAAAHGEEEEDLPPSYAQVVGAGAGAVLDNLGEETFV